MNMHKTPRYGRLLEDFEEGATYPHPWEVTLDGGQIALFQASFLDSTPTYASATFAQALGFRDRPVHPLLLLNLGLSFSVHDVSEQAIAHLAYVDVRFPNPAYPGDTVFASSKVLGKKLASSGDKGVVHVRTVLENQDGVPVCTFERKALVRAGGPLADRPKDPIAYAQPDLGDVPRLPEPLRQRVQAPSRKGGFAGYFEDFAEGDVLCHYNGKTVGDTEHMQLTLMMRNSHPIHFDEGYCKEGNSFAGTRVVYGGLVFGFVASLASRDVCGNVVWDLGFDDGATPCMRRPRCYPSKTWMPPRGTSPSASSASRACGPRPSSIAAWTCSRPSSRKTRRPRCARRSSKSPAPSACSSARDIERACAVSSWWFPASTRPGASTRRPLPAFALRASTCPFVSWTTGARTEPPPCWRPSARGRPNGSAGCSSTATRARRRRCAEASSPRSPVGYWDADLATPLTEVPRFCEVLATQPHVHLVMGSRVQLLGRTIERKLYRHAYGRVFTTMVSMLLSLPVYDTQCGAKLFRVSDELRACFDRPFTTRWIFDVEILARLMGQWEPRDIDTAERIYELPLLVWRDVAGSKIGAADAAVALGDLARLGRIYRAAIGARRRRVRHG
jgi:2-methylfumaryl-CoA hydratase